MAHRSPPRSAPDCTSLYREVTDRIIAGPEARRLPWVQPWESEHVKAPLGLPARRYSGINIPILWGAVLEHDYSRQGWLTFRQALALGGSVRKGERGTTIAFADRFTPQDERARASREGDAARSMPFLKRFTVFNSEQCDGLPGTPPPVTAPIPSGLMLPQVETLIANSGADLRIGGGQTYYDIDAARVCLPPPAAFRQPIDWHRTALHELGHWSGACYRLRPRPLRPLRLGALRAGGTRGRVDGGVRVREPVDCADGPPRRLYRCLAADPTRRRARRRACGIGLLAGRRLPARLPARAVRGQPLRNLPHPAVGRAEIVR